MDTYITSLIESELPLEPWLVGVAWLLLLAGTHIVGRQSWQRLRSQEHVVVEEDASLARSYAPRQLFAQIVFSALVFSLCYFLGEPAFTLFAGGFVAALAMAFGLNLHSLAFARRLHDDEVVNGKITLSTVFVLADMGHRALGCAVAFLITGLVFAQMALLGGAFILAGTGLGSIRKSRRHRAQR